MDKTIQVVYITPSINFDPFLFQSTHEVSHLMQRGYWCHNVHRTGMSGYLPKRSGASR